MDPEQSLRLKGWGLDDLVLDVQIVLGVSKSTYNFKFFEMILVTSVRSIPCVNEEPKGLFRTILIVQNNV